MDLNWIVPILAELAAPVVAGFASWLALVIGSWFGLKKETMMAERIHEAAINAVRMAATALDGKIDLTLPGVNHPLLKLAIPYLESSVREYLTKLKVSPEKVQEILLSKFPIVAAEFTAGGAGVAPAMQIPGLGTVDRR